MDAVDVNVAYMIRKSIWGGKLARPSLCLDPDGNGGGKDGMDADGGGVYGGGGGIFSSRIIMVRD
jgi:hypothetical protein